jgi:hypothetical protein
MSSISSSDVPAASSETAGSSLEDKLKEFGIGDTEISKIKDELGVSTLGDLSQVNEKDLVGVGVKLIPARKLIQSLAPAPTASTVTTFSFDGVLPSVPSDESWIASLRAGGVIKVDKSSVLSAVRAALAHQVGLYEVPERLVAAMERFAEENQEPADPEYFKMRNALTRRSYGEIFEAIEGLDGRYVTDARKAKLFTRIDQHLWPAITTFNGQLQGWQQSWIQSASNPSIMLSVLAGAAGGAGVMPPGMMQPPDTGMLRDASEEVANAVNKVFAGDGTPISAALAYEANSIKATLENSRLPALVGAANREQMLKQLGLAVSAAFPRIEINLTRYVLAILEIKNLPAGNEELQYFSALSMLGQQIPWDQLGAASRRAILTGIGGGARARL